MTTTSLEDEQNFRERYSQQLRELKQERDLQEERQQVKRQAMKTPGRRGEEIKHEEIDREIIRRYFQKE